MLFWRWLKKVIIRRDSKRRVCDDDHLDLNEDPKTLDIDRHEEDNNHKPPSNPEDEKTKRCAMFKQHQAQMMARTWPFHSRFSSNYRLEGLIGQGSFGFVYSAHLQSNQLNLNQLNLNQLNLNHQTQKQNLKRVAVKFILRERVSEWHRTDEWGVVPKEVKIAAELSRCKECLAVRVIDCMSDPVYVYMITEHFGAPWSATSPSSDLFELIESRQSLSSDCLKLVFKQLVFMVDHLQSKHNLVHRDLKDENVLVDKEYNIKLIDFGSADRIISTGQPSHFHGTLAFSAPEIISKRANYDPVKAEIWSLGVILYTMVMRRVPFSDAWSIVNRQVKLPFDDSTVKAGVFDLLRRLLEKDPIKRITLSAIQSHPWLIEP